jgi:hypothetical protein
VLDPQHQRLLWPPVTSVVLGSVLLDGFVRASWRLERPKAGARLLVTTFAPVARKDADAVTAEGMRLLAFLAPHVEKHDVRVTPAE